MEVWEYKNGNMVECGYGNGSMRYVVPSSSTAVREATSILSRAESLQKMLRLNGSTTKPEGGGERERGREREREREGERERERVRERERGGD